MFFYLSGAGRYIPGSGPNPSAPTGVADPFTGEFLSAEEPLNKTKVRH